jgi:two-component system KDP operon response regulator KdpE
VLSSDTARSVLLVEDDQPIRRFLRTALESAGWTVHEAAGYRVGLLEAGRRAPDLVILDLGLPDGNGVEFVRDLRTWSTTPVVVLSARSAEASKIEALDAGADDYLTKPFALGELLARVRAADRRRAAAAARDASFQFGDIDVDLARRVVRRRGEIIHLTPIEYRLLGLFIANAGKVLTHRYILREMWGDEHLGDGHYVRVHMGHLRGKLEDDPAQPAHFITETGIGYRLVE